MGRTVGCELTCMVMIYDKETDCVLVQERKGRGWDGLIFPGGHLEAGESAAEAAVREAKEETGLDIVRPVFCGFVDWAHRESGERYLSFLFRAERFSGELLSETREGRVLWMKLDEYRASGDKSPGMDEYLKCFTGEAGELFARYDEKSADPLILQ